MVIKKFTFRGYEFEDIKAMPIEKFAGLLPARQRRSLKKLTPSQKKLLQKIKKVNEGAKIRIKTHSRDMLIMPEMVGLTIEIHNGQAFQRVEIKPEMLGHYLGEFALTRKRVRHGSPGMGATRSSLYMPLK